MSSGSQIPDLGSGAGVGGGSGGNVREAGGIFGKKEAAEEERYFHDLQRKQIELLKKHHTDEVQHLQELIKDQQEALDKHKKQLEELTHLSKD